MMDNAYTDRYTQVTLPDEEYEIFSLSCPDDKLDQSLIKDLHLNVDYWNQKPWQLQKTDVENVNFFLGDQIEQPQFVVNDFHPDNRLFTGVRAILSYASGQLAKPEIIPSRSDEKYQRMARNIEGALYQHSADEKVDQKTRAALMNLVIRKRGYLKLRYDANKGMYGDVVTEVPDPSDVIIDRYAGFMDNPNKIYHRIRCSVDELCARFPKKKQEILQAFSIIQGRQSQMSRFITYFECWFTYLDPKNIPREGVCWFLPDQHIILDKMPNPNWIYTGDDIKDKQTNVTTFPPKPFIGFNYLNNGDSFIDQTSLVDQARPQQEMLNKRLKQYHDNIDFTNGRWIASKKAFSDSDGRKLVNKGPRTVALANTEDVTKAFANVASAPLPVSVYESVQDLRQTIDSLLGTPSVFRGQQPNQQDTLGRDLLVKQQAGAMQDDLVRAVQIGMEEYYKIKLQMMRVYYTDDYWFQVKGGDGKYDFILLNGDSVDSNVKIGVQIDSTLPLDKADIRNTALELAKMWKIDQLSLLEDLGVPDPEIRTERFMRSQIDPITYMQSVEHMMDNNDAEVDIALLIADKLPPERDNYDEDYLNYFNQYMIKNEFAKLPQDAKQRIVSFIMVIQHKIVQFANMQDSMLNDAGIIDRPPLPPAPKKTEQIRLSGNLDPQTSQELSGAQPPAPVVPSVPTAIPPK